MSKDRWGTKVFGGKWMVYKRHKTDGYVVMVPLKKWKPFHLFLFYRDEWRFRRK